MPVFLSMTTIPSRIDVIYPVIQSLLAQTFVFDLLTLYLPKKCVRQQAHYLISQQLQELTLNTRFQIKLIDEDFGPGTKIIPCIYNHMHDENLDTVLISVDDDIILEKHAIEELVAAYKNEPHVILGFMGLTKDANFIHSEHLPSTMKSFNVHSLGGYRSILYPLEVCKKFLPLLQSLHDEHMQFLKRPVIDDDHAMQQCAIYLNVERKVLRTDYPDKEKNAFGVQIVPFLNIRFLPNKDGVSDSQRGEDLIQPSRVLTESFFKKKKSNKIVI